MRLQPRLQSLLVLAALFWPPVCHAQFQVIAGWEDQIFPSYLLSTSTQKGDGSPNPEHTLGDQYSLLGVVLTAGSDNESVRVTVECDEYMEPSEFSGELPEAGVEYRVLPKIRYRFDRLGQCRQATPATITWRVTQGEGQPHETSTVITVRSINDCPFLMLAGDEAINMNQNFAAYVNEQHPFVDKLLREALDIGVVDRFTGYQDQDQGAVIRQVYALWDLLVSRDVRYSSITATSAVSTQTRSQHVRLIEETVNNTQANCVDGSVLLVSLLRKIGIHSGLVITEDHCYVAFWTDAGRENLFGLETTLIDSDSDEREAPDWIAEAISEDSRGDWSWPSFLAALELGTGNLGEGLAQPADPLKFMLLDIAEARQAGVLPIPCSASEEFLAFDFSGEEAEDGSDDEMSDDEDDSDAEDDSGDGYSDEDPSNLSDTSDLSDDSDEDYADEDDDYESEDETDDEPEYED